MMVDNGESMTQDTKILKRYVMPDATTLVSNRTWLAEKWTMEIGDFPNKTSVQFGDFPASHV